MIQPRKAGQGIIGSLQSLKAPCKLAGEVFFKASSGPFNVAALIRIGDNGQPDTGVRIGVLSPGTDQAVFPVYHYPVEHIVLPALCGKAYRLILHPGDILRVGNVVHVIVHQIIGLFAVLIAEEIQETLG